ncbi:hypothetical protein YT1_0222 [Rhodococcus ruber]|nr:hypothetical protein YT1_0222 [Rhodococcus ruber]
MGSGHDGLDRHVPDPGRFLGAGGVRHRRGLPFPARRTATPPRPTATDPLQVLDRPARGRFDTEEYRTQGAGVAFSSVDLQVGGADHPPLQRLGTRGTSNPLETGQGRSVGAYRRALWVWPRIRTRG